MTGDNAVDPDSKSSCAVDVVIPKRRFGAARLDVFLHGGWSGKSFMLDAIVSGIAS